MREIDYHIAVTLDGYICHENGDIDGFLMEGPHADDFFKSLENYDTVLMGAKTYEFGFKHGIEPGQPAYPNMRHYVFSRSLNFRSSDSVILVSEQVLDVVEDLRQAKGKGIWLCGGGKLAGSLLDQGLIDNLTIKVNPVVFGSGRRLFGDSVTQTGFQHLTSKSYQNGVVLNKYRIMYNK